MMRRRKLISNEQLVVLLAVGLYAALISGAAGEQQGMITKPYMRGLGSQEPFFKNPYPHHPENSDPASMAEFASTDDEANFFIPARRQLADDSGGTAGGVVGVILVVIIVISIIWCCCTGRCGCGRRDQVVVIQQTSTQDQTSTQQVTNPVNVTQHVTMPEVKPPTFNLTLVAPPSQPQPAVPTPGVGEVEMVQEPVLGPAKAGGNHNYAHPGVVSSAPAPQVGNTTGKVPDAGAPGGPAPGYPAYTHRGPPAQYQHQ